MIEVAELQALTGLSRPALYAGCGGCPVPFRIGLRKLAWDRAEVEQWLAARQQVVRAPRAPRSTKASKLAASKGAL
jgi:predicted DNA-binding transcriptional regulator AlpA